MLSLFLGWSFQIRFFSGNLFLTSVFKFFFWWQPTLATVLLTLYYLAFLHLFWGEACVCVCVCVWLTPYFPDAVLHWPLPDGILRVSYHFDILELLLHLLFHFLKSPGLIFLTFYDIVYWPMVWQLVTWFWLSWPVVPLAGSGWCGPAFSGGIWSSCPEFPSSCILMINPEHSRKLVRDNKIINSQFVLLYSFTFSHVLTFIYQ